MQKTEKFAGCMEEARRHFKTADHMAYITFTLLKENRLIIKILNELSESVSNLIKAFLYYESDFKRVSLYRDPARNMKTFVEKIAPRYMEREDLKNLLKILDIIKKHKSASVEFVKKDKFVMLLGEEYETVDIEKVKIFLSSVRKVLAGLDNTIKTTA